MESVTYSKKILNQTPPKNTKTQLDLTICKQKPKEQYNIAKLAIVNICNQKTLKHRRIKNRA